MFFLFKLRKLKLPVDIQLQMFNTIVQPSLLYDTEVTDFEFEKHNMLERLRL